MRNIGCVCVPVRIHATEGSDLVAVHAAAYLTKLWQRNEMNGKEKISCFAAVAAAWQLWR